MRTIRVLLERSFEPNERLEASRENVSLLQFAGYTPLQVLVTIASEIEEGNAGARSALVSDAAEILVQNGARLSMDPPRARRPRRASSGSNLQSEDKVDEPNRRSFSNKEITEVLGGEERLRRAQAVWGEAPTVNASRRLDLLRDDKVSFPETRDPGGSSDKSCAICWKEFGTLVNRKHKCRATRRFVCEACSSKRVLADGKQFRVSDGQFLLARVDAVKDENDRAQEIADRERARMLAAEKARSQARKDRLELEEETNRESLFGGMLGQASNLVFGEEDKAKQQAEKAEGLASSLSETRDALNQRGEQLASIGEKSEKMVDASADFARMAKELRKKSEGGFFW